MQLYKRLSRVGFLQNSYAFKFLFIAFIGIHIPLIGILFFVLYAPQSASSMTILLFALVMTLVATAITLVVLKRLIRPIELASSAANFGYNAATDSYGDLVKDGVIDPAKVARYALQNASSIAGLMLTTEALIADIPEEKAAPAGPPGGGHMGGGGMY